MQDINRYAGEAFREELEHHGLNEEQINEVMEVHQADAERRAAKIFAKNKREIGRLNILAQGAVLENNFASYDYAIRKLRDIYRQPYNDELIQVQWQTTRKQVWELLNAKTN